MELQLTAEFDSFDQAELAARIIRRKVPDIKYISITTQKYHSREGNNAPGALLPMMPAGGAANVTPAALVSFRSSYQPQNELDHREDIRLSVTLRSEYAAKTAGHIIRGVSGRAVKIRNAEFGMRK